MLDVSHFEAATVTDRVLKLPFRILDYALAFRALALANLGVSLHRSAATAI